MRSDACHNRERILDAAAEMLGCPGDTSMKSIARRAGVGQGTLYRHFPTRESLVMQVYSDELRLLGALGSALLEDRTPAAALRAWLCRLTGLCGGAPDLADALNTSVTTSAQQGSEAYGPVHKALSELLRANEATGAVEPGTTAEDVLLLLGPLMHLPPGGDGQARSARLLGVILRGITPSGPSRPGCT